MVTLLGLILAVIVCLIPLAVLLVISGRLQRVADGRLACQAIVTDAIQRELGAVAAPTVKKPLWGPCQVIIPMPLERPALVGRAVALAQNALDDCQGMAGRRVQIIVVPRLPEAAVLPGRPA